MSTALDTIIARLQNMAPFNIHEVTGDGDTQPWFVVTSAIVRDLVITEHNILEQVQQLASQIMYWGRLQAQAKRIWEIEERRYRIWRDKALLQFAKLKEREQSKTTKDQLEQQMRGTPGYHLWQERLERAEEAYNSVGAVLEGFRAKKELMRLVVIRRAEDAAPCLSI
jgi:hypothetical protein